MPDVSATAGGEGWGWEVEEEFFVRVVLVLVLPVSLVAFPLLLIGVMAVVPRVLAVMILWFRWCKCD